MIRPLFAVLVGFGALVGPAGEASAAVDSACGGVVFRDLDADGRRVETLEHDLTPDDLDPGVGGVAVTIIDADGAEHESRTTGNGLWSIDLRPSQYPIRVEFAVPDGHSVGRPGAHAGTTVQFVMGPDECDGRPLGNLGVYPVDEFCAGRPEIAVPCYVTDDHESYGEMPAIRAVSNAAVDDADTASTSIDDWMRPVPRTIATHGAIGTVYGQASRRDGTIFAAAFTKRHTRLRSELNSTGNPTVIYEIAPDAPPTVLARLTPSASDPHGPSPTGDDWADLDVMDAVYTTGLGDLELSPDETELYAVDLGRRELAVIDPDSGEVRARRRLDGAALGRSDCNVSAANRFGDLRAFGLGWRDDTLLVGVVCSAASTVVDGSAVRETGDPGPAAGDHGQLVGYVYEYAAGSFEQVLAWPLSGDRGETQANGLLSNDAAWHPWVATYPFDDEHDAVSYPQPAITDLVVDGRGNLVIALGDRWAHQTAPESVAPAWDGRTRRVSEPIAAGDLQRACRRSRGWVIEGSQGCEGGIGNGWEFFDGDSYGWHAETALGSVARLPGRAEVVVTQMNPKTEDDTWRSGGLVWHGTDEGDARHAVRLYDGRSADPDHTFEQASGLGDLAILCGGPSPSIGGSIWHDRDADGLRDPGDGPVEGAVIELRDVGGEVLSIDVTGDLGDYAFDDGNVVGGLERGAPYVVTLAGRNGDPTRGVLAGIGPHTGLVPTIADVGDRDDLDSDAVEGASTTLYAGLPTIEVSAGGTNSGDPTTDHSNDIGLRDRYDLSITTSQGLRTREHGVVSFRIEVRNEGSLPSGSFEVRANLPAETSLRMNDRTPSMTTEIDSRSVAWSFDDAHEIRPGGTRTIDMHLQVNDPTVESITNTVEIVLDSGADEDSEPGVELGEDDEDRLTIELFGLSGSVWVDLDTGDTERMERGLEGLVVYVLDDDGNRVGATTTDDSGRFLFDSFPAGVYRIAIPASEFDSGRPAHGYDRAIGAESSDVDRMLTGGGLVASKPIGLGSDSDVSATIDLGLERRPPQPFIDVFVLRVLLPITALCIGFLLLDRRRHVGGITASRA